MTFCILITSWSPISKSKYYQIYNSTQISYNRNHERRALRYQMDTYELRLKKLVKSDLVAVGLTFPLLYPQLRLLGASHTLVGVFGATYSGLQVLTGPIVGCWSDLRGRKFVASIILIVSAICYFFTGVTKSLLIIYLLRIILGFTKHTQTLCKALISDNIPKEKQTKVYGWSTAVSSLGFVVGPIIGGHLSELNNGFSYVCTLTSLIFICNYGLIHSFPENVTNFTKTKEKIRLNNIKYELTRAVMELTKMDWKQYWDVFSLRFLFSLAVSIYFSNQTLYIQEEYNLSQKYIGYIISFFSIVGCLSAMITGYLTSTFYKHDSTKIHVLFHLFIIMTISFFGIYISSSLILFLILLTPFAFSTAALRIVSMEVILNKSHSNDRGSLAGVSSSVMSIGRFISPVVSGVIADAFGGNKVIIFATAPSLVATLLCFTLICRHKILKKGIDKKV
ncbi:hypothetical protein FQA39_LY00614 [Lamprigera yunnana]|nr:hypothetical protein FQA39_LY00614 [Lamprigera yunnana]